MFMMKQTRRGTMLAESPGSSRGACVVVGNGGRLPNMRQKGLILGPPSEAGNGMVELKSCFQIARVTRRLMSVGKMCDGGITIVFTDKTATIEAPDGNTACVFTRKPGALHICKMRLKPPFPGQG